MKLVLKQNEVMNLTAVTDEDDFVAKHLLDSLAALGLPELEAAGRVVDVGTGAGFPGVPLAIAYPGKDFLLIDSLRKRVDFLDEACAKLGIENVRTLHARAEDAARMNEDGTKSVKRQLNEDDTKSAKRQLNEDSTKNAKGQPSRTVRHRMASPCHSGLRPGIHPPLREGFDLAVCRAVGHIAVLCEYCLPLVRVGGAVYAYKSESQAEEAAESAAALATLGASARVEVISADELFKHKRDGRLCEKSVIAATVECHAAEPLHSSMCEVQRSGSSCTSASEPQSHFKSIDFQEIPDQVRDDGSVFTQSDGSFCVATSAKERAQAAETPRHIIMVIKKERPTPDKYPRRPGAPAKSPL
ncbi:MAG: 16S rRNA (guanine(527)-N(7))-methyltransferase RsmG [Clostridiales Family XIII bacterium]|nr:16S rRNA (guanine(527)-N(7))-methyltransferase RsmG [Clostridiales Family XIII bacterium]